MIDIDNLTEAQLIDLNNRIIARLRMGRCWNSGSAIVWPFSRLVRRGSRAC